MTLEVRIQQLDSELALPRYALAGDAGCDVLSRIDLELAPGQRAMVPTGIAIAVPDGYACFVHPRSGLAAKHGITMLNAPGTIDSGYRGEINVIVINHDSSETFHIKRGDRIAQLVFQKVENAVFVGVEDIAVDADSSSGAATRGARGFGSTGLAGAVAQEEK